MLAILAFMFAASFAALAFVDDDDTAPPEDDTPPPPPPLESAPLPEPELEPEPEAEPDAASDAEPAPLFTLQTDPVTGATDITVAPEADGRLMAFFSAAEFIPGNSSVSGGEAYGLTLVLVPDDVDFEEAANSFDWQTFLAASSDAGITLDRADYFAAIGVELVQHWDLGQQGETNPVAGTFSGDYNQIRFDDRTLLPEITANRDIAWFELTDNEELLGLMFGNVVASEPVTGPEAFFDFQTTVETYAFQTAAGTPSGGEENWEERVFLSPNDGDMIMGSEFADVILHPPGDPTAVTIIGGAGEDKIFAGLNDTVITDDDSDRDIIYVDTPASFAQIYDEVPVIQAGSEDVIEIEPSGSLVIGYAIDRGAGVTDYLYHIVHAPDGFAAPNTVLGAGDSPVSLEAYYLAAGIQLMAVGDLGSLDQSDPTNPVDTRIAPPAFDGPSLGFQLAQLTGDTITAATVFTTTSAISPVA